MQEIDLDCLLNQNQWVSSANAIRPSNCHKNTKIRIGISSRGHELIHTLGLPAFEQQALMDLPDDCLAGRCWAFRQIDFNFPCESDLISKEDLPPVISMLKSPLQYRLLLEITPDSHWFEGHFPGYPVLAGITQLHWAVSFSMGLLNFKSFPVEIARLKYKNLITPPAIVELSLHQVSENEVQFELTSLDLVYSLGRLKFEHTTE